MTNPNLAADVRKYWGPYQALGNAGLASAKKLAELQLESFSAYTKMGLEHLNGITAAKGGADIQTLASKQMELAKAVAERASADFKAVAELGQAYVTETREAIAEGVAAATPKKS